MSTRIRIGILFLALSLVGQAFPSMASNTSLHMCEYVRCHVPFGHYHDPQPIDPADYAAVIQAGQALFYLVRDHFGMDVLLGS